MNPRKLQISEELAELLDDWATKLEACVPPHGEDDWEKVYEVMREIRRAWVVAIREEAHR